MANALTMLLPKWAIILIYSTLIFLIILGNLTVVLIVIIRKHMRSVTNMFIVSLSVADLIVGLFVGTSVVLETVGDTANELFCYLSPYIELACISASILSLLAITVDRFRAVVTSTAHKLTIAYAKKVILAIWCISFAYACRIFIQFEVTEYLTKTNQLANKTLSESVDDIEVEEAGDDNDFCNFMVEESTHDFVFRVIDFVLLFILPCFAMVFMYQKLIHKLWKQGMQLGPSTQRKRSVVKMLILDVILFFFCWGPFYCLDIVRDALELGGATATDVQTDTYTISRFVCILLALSNSCLDPVVYAYFNTNFRSEVKLIFNELFTTSEETDQGDIVTDSPKSSNSVHRVCKNKIELIESSDSLDIIV